VRLLLGLFVARASLLEQVAVELGLVALLLLDVDAGDVASAKELNFVAVLVEVVVVD